MRITFVHATTNLSGGNRVVAAYAERLQRRGHEVCVVTGSEPWPMPMRRVLNRLRGIDHPSGDNRSWLTGTDVEERIVDGLRIEARHVPDADVIVATWWQTAEWVACMPASKGAKAFFLQGIEWTIDGQSPERVAQTWRLPLHKIVIAEFMAEIAAERFGDGDASLVPNSVDTELFDAVPRGKQAVPTVGLMQPGDVSAKGWDVVHGALLAAKKQLPELRGQCFGRYPPADEYPMPDWVDLVISPPQADLTALYGSCDVFIHGARAEGFGLPLLEAMACRTPVVATPAGAAPELLPSGGGTMVPQEDSQAMADALVAICRLPDADWRARSDAAYARATGYTLDDATLRMEQALERAVDKGRRRAYSLASGRSVAAGEAGSISLLSRLAWGDAVHGARPSEHWTLDGLVSAGAADDPEALLRALRHPESVACVEVLSGAARLLVDPLGRDEGVVHVSAADGTPVGQGARFAEPPLRRVLTLWVPLVDRWRPEWGGHLELWGWPVEIPSTFIAGRGRAVLFATDRAAPVSFAPLASNAPPLRHLCVHYYAADADPDGLPEPGPRVGVRPEARLPARLLSRAQGARGAARFTAKWAAGWVRERYFGFEAE